MQEQEPFKLEVVSVRLVKDAPLFSDHKITTPQDAVKVVGDFLCEMDREVLCIINLKSDGSPINCSIVSMGQSIRPLQSRGSCLRQASFPMRRR